MLQVIQNIRSGDLTIESIPAPSVKPGQVLIANEASLVSSGTEKMVMDLAKKSLLGKARERPDQVRRVLQKIRSEGLVQTINAVQSKLNEPMTMGYSSAGTVLACGAGVEHFKPGDRVASNGPHAEVVSIPHHLCASVPDHLPAQHACFAVLGSIAMQGIRLSKCQLDECVVVIGLGLVGQLTVGIAKAAGLRVIGTDPDEGKCELAKKMGADIATEQLSGKTVEQFTNGLGADSVVITASTKSNEPIELAANCVRQKGRVVLVGVVGLNLDRRPFFFKEAEFVVSCSYGPGRYDPDYEQRGQDYPAAYVRWTEQRNIQSVIDLMANGSLNVSHLISHQFKIDDAVQAYKIIDERSEPFLGIVLQYPNSQESAEIKQIQLKPANSSGGSISFGALGAGNFARMMMLPEIAKHPEFVPISICSARGVSSTQIGKQMGFSQTTTDEETVFNDPAISTVFSFTRHDQHATHVLKAIDHSKNIFVEKPLCISTQALFEIDEKLNSISSPPLVMVGFNRRYSPSARAIRKFFEAVDSPLTVSIRFNSGEVPAEHWTQNELEGGGRIIGEACHGIDLASYLTGSPAVRVFAESIRDPANGSISDDQCFITIRHANGSVSNIGYLSGGDRAFGKERVEVFGGGRVGVIDDFRSYTTCANGKSKTVKSRMDKGHASEIEFLRDCLLGKSVESVNWSELRATTLASILAVQSLREGVPLELDDRDLRE